MRRHKAVHYPPDRRFRIWIRPSILIGIGIPILAVFAAAWIQVAIARMIIEAAVFLLVAETKAAEETSREVSNCE